MARKKRDWKIIAVIVAVLIAIPVTADWISFTEFLRNDWREPLFIFGFIFVVALIAERLLRE